MDTTLCKNRSFRLDSVKFKKISVTDVLFLVSLLFLGLGFSEVAILFVLFYSFTHSKLRVQKNILYFLLLLLIPGVLISILNIHLHGYQGEHLKSILLRDRFFIIRTIYALVVAVYLKNLSKYKVLHLVFLIAMVNLTVGLFQLGTSFLNGEFTRISMVSAEPSSAAMFYVFSAPLLYLYTKYDEKYKKYIWLFLACGLLILSKALILVFIFWAGWYSLRSRKKTLILPFIGLLAVLFGPALVELSQISALYNFFQTFSAQGLTGLTVENKIYTSFTLRISSFLASLNLFLNNPQGIGFGLFHPFYIDYMTSENIGSSLTGYEIQQVISGNMYGTPKSSMMELIVSSGFFYLIPLLKYSWQMIQDNIDLLLKISFISLILVSFMVEIAPFLTYLVILFVLQRKL